MWELTLQALGELLNLVAAPLGLGRVELEDGQHATGFLCEATATATATDVTHFGGWRAYLAGDRPEVPER